MMSVLSGAGAVGKDAYNISGIVDIADIDLYSNEIQVMTEQVAFGVDYITIGKWYDAHIYDKDNPTGFGLTADHNKTTYCLIEGCAHLGSKNWNVRIKPKDA